MCGFVAFLALDGRGVERQTVARMAATLEHRGPDDEGSYLSGPVGFGFRRLSILDLTPAGHQPMSTPEGDFTIVFNGEIYNYRELRQKLEARGHRFRSSGDTEVLLHAYNEWGPDCLSRLNGMWAFVIHDRRRGRLFGARDRFGVKPLFRYRGADCLMFASEIKALRASGLWRKGINWPVAADFLMRGALDESGATFYEGIEQVGAGVAFEAELDGSYREWRYWRIEDTTPANPADPAAEFAELFEDAVSLHLRSDVPVGVHLSGGLDSTALICAAARLRGKANAADPLMAFSYVASEYDETRYIADTLRQTRAQLVRLESEPARFWDRLAEVLWFQDEPFHSLTPLVSYELMRMTAAHGIKVVLNGQGADETLAGYGSFFRDYWNTLLRSGAVAQTWREMGAYAAEHGGSPRALFMHQVRHALQTELHGFGAYRRLSAWRNRRGSRADDWFSPHFAEKLSERSNEPVHRDLNAALAGSMRRQPLPLYLRVEDRNSMAHSIEVRVPFLDHRLVAFVYGLPAHWKMRGPWNKYVLREAMRSRIPESVRTRVEKFGFPVPVRKWLTGSLYEPARALLTGRQSRERGIYQVDNIVRDLDRYRRGEIDVGLKLFRLVQFELWSGFAEGAYDEEYARRFARA